MDETKKAKLIKLTQFAEHQQLGIFNELNDLNFKLQQLITATQDSKQEDIEVSNLSDIKLELTPLDANFKALQGSVDMIMKHLMNTKGMDMSGITKLLKKIADKKSESVDLKELVNISIILEDVLLAVQTTASATALKPEKLQPDIKKIQEILNALNENLVAFDIPNFDYKRLEEMLKKHLNISVTGGGGTSLSNIWSNTKKDGTGTNYQPVLTSKGHLETITPTILIEGFESITGFTGSTDVTGITVDTEHRGVGSYSIAFNKSGVTQAFSLIEKTIVPIDIEDYIGHHDIDFNLKLPSITDVAFVYVALGSDISNNIYWQTDVSELKNGWNSVIKSLRKQDAQLGIGADFSNITWVGVYIGFNAITNTLTGIKVDNVELHNIQGHYLEDIASGVKPLSGASTNGTVALTLANTWYQVPSTIPVSDYELVIAKETVTGTIHWSGSNTGTPNANGIKLLTGTLEGRLAGGKPLYIGSDIAGDIIRYNTIII